MTSVRKVSTTGSFEIGSCHMSPGWSVTPKLMRFGVLGLQSHAVRLHCTTFHPVTAAPKIIGAKRKLRQFSPESILRWQKPFSIHVSLSPVERAPPWGLRLPWYPTREPDPEPGPKYKSKDRTLLVQTQSSTKHVPLFADINGSSISGRNNMRKWLKLDFISGFFQLIRWKWLVTTSC